MKQINAKLKFIGLTSVVLLILIGYLLVSEAHAIENPIIASVIAPNESAARPQVSFGPSCSDQTPEMVAGCRALADRILASTVRLELIAAKQDGRGNDLITGHGTVLAGRYVLTHNHYGLTPEEFGDGRLLSLSIYRADGSLAVKDVLPGSFSLIVVAPETLLLDFGDFSGQGLFGIVGLASAELAVGAAVSLQLGDEVAQIDWNGVTAYVVWARVTAVNAESGAPYVELDSFVERGASGGGVFYNGVHIANNWSRNTDLRGDTGETLRRYSLAALNTENITTLN
jgi:hypothetical protein